MSKKLFQWMLMATIVLGLSVNITSCKDDDDNTSEQQGQDSSEGMSSLEDDVLRNLICQWCDLQQDELTGSGWQQQRYEPTVGGVLDDSKPAVRSIAVGSMDAADHYALACFNSMGIDFSQPNGFTYTDPAVGTLKYNHVNDGNTLAVIDVDVKQMPQLQQICLVKEWSTNDHGAPYYHFGDIIKYKNRFYLCVSRHGYKETARFITLNDHDNHSTGTFNWMRKGKDVVYNDEMASAETMTKWVADVLLNDEAYSDVVRIMLEKEEEANLRQLVPETQALRQELADVLFEEASIVTDLLVRSPYDKQIRIEGYTWDDIDNEGTLIAPMEHLLAGKVRWKQSLTSSWHQWVPYIVCLPDDSYDKFSQIQNATASQGTLSPGHFRWSRMGGGKMNGQSLVSKNVKSGSYSVCYLAMHWTHDYYIGPGDANCYMLLDFTKDWIDHPRAFVREKVAKNPNSWLRRCITSSEITFTDKGTKLSKYENFSVKGNL